MSAHLGKMLLEAGVINEAQLEEAIQAQVIFGGKLGTNIINLGYANIATLSRFLSRKLSVPTIDATRMKTCPREVLKLFGKKLAKKYSAVPLAMEGSRMDVLLSNPADFNAIDEMAFATGKSIKAYIAPELVIMALMEKYYGIQREMQYVQLSIQDTREMRRKPGQRPAGSLPMGETPKKDKGPMGKQAEERLEIKGLDFGRSEDFTTEEGFRDMMDSFQSASKDGAPSTDAKPAPPPPSGSMPPPPPTKAAAPQQPTPSPPPQAGEKDDEVFDLEEMIHEAPQWSISEPGARKEKGEISDEEELEELEVIEELPEALTLDEAARQLTEVQDRDELGRVVLAFALSFFKRAALFTTRGGMAMGWDGMGGSLNSKTIQGIMLPLNMPSIFKTVFDTSAFYLGAVPKAQLNDRFLKLIGNEKPNSVFLIPILFRGKVVNILYGDNGHESNAPTDISDLLILAPKVPLAFEALIMRKKQQTSQGD